jgi:3-hydroxybutyryl-CoA dehydrogenase
VDFQTIGVIGAGVMGIGVSHSLALANHRILLLDISEAQLERARQEIRQNARFLNVFNTSGAVATPDEVLSRITFATDYQLLENADYVIENVTEKWEIKRYVYQRISSICPGACIFAVNTSAISITRVAAITDRPEKVIGVHFMNPAPLKPTVEVIRGHHTSEQTIQATKDLLASMGKNCIVVNDWPGFVTNRVMMLTVNEAAFLVQEQVASVAEVDRLFKLCFGHKMGPLETADLIGLDTVLLSINVLYESFNDSKYRPCPLLKKMVDAGLYGRKSGKGFYTYQETDM